MREATNGAISIVSLPLKVFSELLFRSASLYFSWLSRLLWTVIDFISLFSNGYILSSALTCLVCDKTPSYFCTNKLSRIRTTVLFALDLSYVRIYYKVFEALTCIQTRTKSSSHAKLPRTSILHEPSLTLFLIYERRF